MGGKIENKQCIKDQVKDALPVAMVFGFFPRVYNGNITYFGIPQFRWFTIPVDDFQGYNGFFIIYGTYKPHF